MYRILSGEFLRREGYVGNCVHDWQKLGGFCLVFGFSLGFCGGGALGAPIAPKVKAGVALDREILRKINVMIEASKYLEVSRSEVVDAILAAFFKSPFNHVEKARELIIKRRKGCSKNRKRCTQYTTKTANSKIIKNQLKAQNFLPVTRAKF